MPLRAPAHVWRFLAADLLRIGGLATVLLSLVIAFTFSLRFLAEGTIDLAGALRFTLLALVPMLQYALPFAGAFGASLTYHRFAADNELWAAMGSGMSHRSLIMPAAALAACVGLVVAALADQAIPRFLRAMEEFVRRDMAGVLTRSIEQGESVRLGNIELFARSLVRVGPDPSIDAVDRLRLSGVLAATLDQAGRVTGFLTADDVSVWLFQDDLDGASATTAQFLFRGARGEGVGDAVRSGEFASHRVRVPSGLRDNPKFLTGAELADLLRRPERFGPIDARRRVLIRRLAENRAAEAASAALASTGLAMFERSGGEVVVVRAAGLRADGAGWEFEPVAGEPILIEMRSPSGRSVALAAAGARLEREADDRADVRDASVPFRLSLTGVRRTEDEPTDQTPRAAETIGGLVAPHAPIDDLAGLNVARLIGRARAEAARVGADAAAVIRAAADALESRAADLRREIVSKRHERAAAAASCFVALLLGSVTALRRAGGLVLPVYLWAFFPALAAVITISAGQRLTHKSGDWGLAVLWGGVAALLLLLLIEYRRLVRH